MSEHPKTSPSSLARLVADIRAAVQAGGADDPERSGWRVAAAVAPHLLADGLLTPEQSEPDPRSYKQHVLHVEPGGAFSVVALVWLPGQRTTIHDHVSWCVTGTYVGAEEEVRYRLVEDGAKPCLVPVAVTTNEAGEVDFIVPPGDIHEVRNSAECTTVSIHVYGADMGRLGSSIRRTYDLPRRPAEVRI
ncbi:MULTISPECIES: cysteine dioxygenase family protein [Streptomyces]|uniref:cysteine dioxygenase family protein n=1 Tax=Streptomyces TaxID=1883 RepID=UPI000A6152A5|nr:cysteine dioxygenase family protein [Streptomyces sp. NRRL S-4]